jgi:hypothetical protein
MPAKQGAHTAVRLRHGARPHVFSASMRAASVKLPLRDAYRSGEPRYEEFCWSKPLQNNLYVSHRPEICLQIDALFLTVHFPAFAPGTPN